MIIPALEPIASKQQNQTFNQGGYLHFMSLITVLSLSQIKANDDDFELLMILTVPSDWWDAWLLWLILRKKIQKLFIRYLRGKTH